jgi:hypothetical protein
LGEVEERCEPIRLKLAIWVLMLWLLERKERLVGGRVAVVVLEEWIGGLEI